MSTAAIPNTNFTQTVCAWVHLVVVILLNTFTPTRVQCKQLKKDPFGKLLKNTTARTHCSKYLFNCRTQAFHQEI